jgi:hypothetical protein
MHLPLTGLGRCSAFPGKEVLRTAKQMSAKIWKNRENIRVYIKAKLSLKIQTFV